MKNVNETRVFKSKEKSSWRTEATAKFYGMYGMLKDIDNAIEYLGCASYRLDDTIQGCNVCEDIVRLRNEQSLLIVKMMDLNSYLKIKDPEVDDFLRFLVGQIS